MSEHSKFSASAAHRWLRCPGSIVLEKGAADNTSRYAAEGTVAHLLFTYGINGNQPVGFLGRIFQQDGFDITVTQEMVDAVETALANTRESAGDAVLMADTKVNYSSHLQVPKEDAWGTLDVIAIGDTELQVRDFKYGMGVEVDAKDNEQMILYAGGALDAVDGLMNDFETVRLFIDQPRIKSAPSEWGISVADLKAQLQEMRSKAQSVLVAEDYSRRGPTWEKTFLNPGEKQCRFCKAKATCPALRDYATEEMLDHRPADPSEFEAIKPLSVGDAGPHADAGWLAAVMSKADLIESWLKAVRAEVSSRLHAGVAVEGWKLVIGKKGNRAWVDEKRVEAYLKDTARLADSVIYTKSVISPAAAEALVAKAKSRKKDAPPAEVSADKPIGPRQWSELQKLITQADGKPHVAPASDPAPAYDPQPVEFTPIVDEEFV